MECPSCKKSAYTKDGIVRGLQGYKCKHCNYRYTIAKKSDHKSAETKRLDWVKKWGEEVSLPKTTEPVEIVELDEKHTPSKSETFTVEGYNARIRHYLARFRRKTKCYSKAVHMIENSLKLLILKLNNQLTILN